MEDNVSLEQGEVIRRRIRSSRVKRRGGHGGGHAIGGKGRGGEREEVCGREVIRKKVMEKGNGNERTLPP
jgi:hypothetical protein